MEKRGINVAELMARAKMLKKAAKERRKRQKAGNNSSATYVMDVLPSVPPLVSPAGSRVTLFEKPEMPIMMNKSLQKTNREMDSAMGGRAFVYTDSDSLMGENLLSTSALQRTDSLVDLNKTKKSKRPDADAVSVDDSLFGEEDRIVKQQEDTASINSDFDMMLADEFSDIVESLVEKMNHHRRIVTCAGVFLMMLGLVLTLLWVGSLSPSEQGGWLKSEALTLSVGAFIVSPTIIFLVSARKAWKLEKKAKKELQEEIEREAAIARGEIPADKIVKKENNLKRNLAEEVNTLIEDSMTEGMTTFSFV
jgi:hypothetical protein